MDVIADVKRFPVFELFEKILSKAIHQEEHPERSVGAAQVARDDHAVHRLPVHLDICLNRVLVDQPVRQDCVGERRYVNLEIDEMSLDEVDLKHFLPLHGNRSPGANIRQT